MKILKSHIQEYLSTPLSAEAMADALIAVGLETTVVKLSQGFENVVVAKVLEFTKHPNADRLRLCKVSDGTTTYQIVCGASNFQAGDLVALSKVGAVLPNGMLIKKSKIRDVESEGMLCSESELGLKDTSEGILILQNAAVGDEVSKVLGLNDELLVLELTPNRGDCLSVRGIAREIGAKLSLPTKVTNTSQEGEMKGNPLARVDASKECHRYCLLEFDSVEVKPSDTMKQNRLKQAGIRSINNVVDTTNLTMLEWGQPMHAFDADKIKGQVCVRFAKENEKIVCLDEVERVLTEQDLIIADDAGPIAIAGVMGGLSTAVSEKTKRIFLESAHFSPTLVRKTSKRLALHTESSHRFERTVDAAHCYDAAKEAAEILKTVSHCRAVGQIDLKNKIETSQKIQLRTLTLERILGLAPKDVGDYLIRLGFGVEKSVEGWLVEVPSRRPDITREIDLVEEVARVHGLDAFASALPPLAKPSVQKGSYEKMLDLKHICKSFGLSEARTYSFASEKQNKLFSQNQISIQILNALHAEISQMRLSLVPSLIEVWKNNFSKQNKRAELFEVARSYEKINDATKETWKLSALMAGQTGPHWASGEKTLDVYDVLGVFEGISKAAFKGQFRFEPQGAPVFLHPGKSGVIKYKNKGVGFLGELHPRILKQFEIKPACVFEMNISEILVDPLSLVSFKPFSAYPSIERDFAFVVNETLPQAEIQKTIEAQCKPLLMHAVLFDVYQGKGIEAGQKSLAYRLTFGSNERTLTDVEVDGVTKKMLEAVTSQFKAVLRA